MELKGTNFTIRPWRPGDVTSLVKHANNPNVSACLFDRFPSPYTMDDALTWVDFIVDKEPVTYFVIAVDDEVVGGIGLDFRQDVYRKAPLLGYWLSEEYWGSGIMTEAVQLVVGYAFANFDIVKLQAGVFSNNPKSMRVLEKAGFVREGILRSTIFKNGVVLDEVVYGLVK
jgi:ribosomal-protein-alanine N-acetyltransferase